MDELTQKELVAHLIKIGGRGNSQPARDLRMLVKMQYRKYKKSGRDEEAASIMEALKATGWTPMDDIFRGGET